MRYLLISVAAALAVASAVSICAAQEDKTKGPGIDQQSPGAGKAERQPRKSMPQQGSDRDQRKSTQQRQAPDKDQPKSAQQPTPHKGAPKSAQQQQAPDKKDQHKAAEGPAIGKQKSAEPKSAPGQDRPTAAGQAQPGTDKSAVQDKDKASDRVHASAQPRNDIRKHLAKETRVGKTRINVTVNIGRTIPRSVRLHTLPIDIVSIAPAYRGYQYVVLEDETIVIVDPRTYVVMDVISTGGPEFALSPGERHFIFATVPKNRTAHVRVRLGLGAEVPRSIELLTFPHAVIERVPQIRGYRYIVSEDDIVVVDPTDYGVVLVISE
jgi:Protein of unknown function (DUF1236)